VDREDRESCRAGVEGSAYRAAYSYLTRNCESDTTKPGIPSRLRMTGRLGRSSGVRTSEAEERICWNVRGDARYVV
jgi:hypothetical protein